MIETIRTGGPVELKRLRLEDAENIFVLVDKNRTYLREWLPWVDKTNSIQDIRKFIEDGLKRDQSGEGFELGIWYEGHLTGVVGVTIKKDHFGAQIGYWLGEEFQSKGLMTTAVRALTQHLLQELKLHRVVIRAAVGNKKSKAVPERLGFTMEGILRDEEYLYDHFVDLQVYSMLAQEYKP